MNRTLFSNKFFLGGLIGCLILIAGLCIFIRTPPKHPFPNGTLQGGSTTTKPDADVLPSNAVLNEVKTGTPSPTEDEFVKLTEAEKWKVIRTKHTGPQTVEALMESYHVMYRQLKWHREIDEAYPPEPWLQSVLDKGYTILTYPEYVQYMDARAKPDELDNPTIRKSESRVWGIPESDIENLKTAYLENHLFFLQRAHAAQRATDEIITGGFYIGDKLLPVYRDRDVVYVQGGGFSAEFLGTSLNAAQCFNLIFRGIEPEGIEVIYIDEKGNRLAEKPAPITREEFQKKMSEGQAPPPEEWWDLDAPIPDDFEEFLPPENTEPHPSVHSTKESAQAEFEQFMQEIRQLEEFATLSDAEIAAEIENQLRQQLLPELPTDESLENAHREKGRSKPPTPERFEKARQTLQRHGPKEGLRRLAKDDPELAEYFLRTAQKVPPKRSRPTNPHDERKPGIPE